MQRSREPQKPLGFASLARDLGYELKVVLWSDSTAARGVAATKGLSCRTRHMEVKFLWLHVHWQKGSWIGKRCTRTPTLPMFSQSPQLEKI